MLIHNVWVWLDCSAVNTPWCKASDSTKSGRNQLLKKFHQTRKWEISCFKIFNLVIGELMWSTFQWGSIMFVHLSVYMSWIAKMAIFFLMCIVLFFFWCVNLSWGKRTCVLVCNKFEIINITIVFIQYRYCCLLGVAAHNKNISSWMMNYSTWIGDTVRTPQ